MTTGSDEQLIEEIDLAPSPQLLEAIGDIPYKPWPCLAELIDNSFDDFLSNPDRAPGEPPVVRITLPRANDDNPIVCVADNGRGMSREMLQNALKAGYSGKRRYGSLGCRLHGGTCSSLCGRLFLARLPRALSQGPQERDVLGRKNRR